MSKKEKELEVTNQDEKVEEVLEDIKQEKLAETKHEEKVEKENKVEEVVNNPKVKDRKLYFGFEARIICFAVCSVLFFGIACFFFLKTINFGKGEIVYYDEVASAKYNVCLKDNNYYDKSCLGEEMQYASALVDSVVTSFNYDVNFSTDISYDLSYHVVGVTKIYDASDRSKILYQNEDLLVEKTKVADYNKWIKFQTNVSVDFNKYNASVLEYKNNYASNSMAVFDIVLYLNEPTETRQIASVSIPLGGETFGITKEAISNKNRAVEIDDDSWNDTSTIYAIIACIFLITSLIFLYRLTYLIFKVATNKSKYETKLKHLLNAHNDVVVVAKEGYSSSDFTKIIKVDNFDELLKVRETLDKPIVFSKVNDVKSEFVVEEGETLYKYVFKEADL
ncbi:MAG: hypothetical protein IJI22_04870 [Bacilli bacterium]|nr:hypothetical protein [Bacilli bacterium]